MLRQICSGISNRLSGGRICIWWRITAGFFIRCFVIGCGNAGDGIRGEISVMGQCTKKPLLSEVEFCTVFSNMIQNAVEEVKRQQEKKKYIKVKIKQGNQYLSITVKNSSKLLWDRKEKDLTTVKKDKKNHGIGIGNIIETAEKNGGSFELTGDGTEVTAILLLPYS